MYDGEEGREGGGRREEGGKGGKCSVLNNFYFFSDQPEGSIQTMRQVSVIMIRYVYSQSHCL